MIMAKPITRHHGKDIDILSLKSPEMDTFQSRADGIRKISQWVQENRNSPEVEEVKFCHICHRTEFTPTGVEIYGLEYIQCIFCHHVFTRYRMTESALERYYSEDKSYASIYTDKKTLEKRLQSVARPKLDWANQCFETEFGKRPRKILDLGAGGGHFVKAARLAGCAADGVEISEEAVMFAREAFELELFRVSFEQFARSCPDGHDYDLCTFWGVLEHVSNPMDFLQTAREFLARSKSYPNVAIIAAAPHFQSMSTTVQKVFPEHVIRHLNPVSHMQMFTVPSIGQAFSQIDYEQRHIWFFGMDAYELVTQTLRSNSNAPLTAQHRELILQLQRQFDLGEMSDEVTVFAVPPAASVNNLRPA